MDFTARARDMAELEKWRDDQRAARLSAVWLHGPGGQGKTRLAAEFATRSAAAGWLVVHADHAVSAGARQRPQDLRVGESIGLLLVVDYADRWPAGHLAWLFDNALLSHPVPTRILFLARGVQLWPTIRATLEDYCADSGSYALGMLDGQTSSGAGARGRMFRVARDCFAARYGIVDPREIKEPDSLAGPEFGLTLALHMAALVAVDAHDRGVPAPSELVGLSLYLLDKEERHWTRLYENRLEGLPYQTSPAVMARAVFTATLTGAMPRARAVELLYSLNLDGHPAGVLADHAECYPPDDCRLVLEPLYPDRLAEDFVALSLPGAPSSATTRRPWATEFLDVLTRRQANGTYPEHTARAVTYLASSAAPGRWSHAVPYLAKLISQDPELPLAAGGAALTAVAAVADLDVDILAAIEQHFPTRHIDLDPGIAAITRRLTDHRLGRTTDLERRARLYMGLANRLQMARQTGEAATAAHQAVECWRTLAAASPGEYEARLADSLAAHAAVLAFSGSHEAAAAPAEEALTLLRDLRANAPGDHTVALLTVLVAHASSQSAVPGRQAAALHRVEEADELCQAAGAEIDPALRFTLWQTHAQCLLALGQLPEALAVVEGGLPSVREWAGRQPEVFAVALASMLVMVALLRRALGDEVEAQAAVDEAEPLARQWENAAPMLRGGVDLGMELARRVRPGLSANDLGALTEVVREGLAPYNDLADSPIMAALRYALAQAWFRAKDWNQALSAADEVVEIRRSLAAGTPGAYDLGLARALVLSASSASLSHQYEAAVRARREAVELCERGAASNPAEYEPLLADSLVDLGYDLMRWDRPDEMYPVFMRAMDACRRVWPVNPDHYRMQLLLSLAAVKGHLSQFEEPANEMALVCEGLTLACEAAEAGSSPWTVSTMAAFTDGLVAYAHRHGWDEERVELVSRARGFFTGRAAPSTAETATYIAEHATVLSAHAAGLISLGRDTEALADLDAAIELRRQMLRAEQPFAKFLLGCDLFSRSGVLERAGAFHDSYISIAEAVTTYRAARASDSTDDGASLWLALVTLEASALRLGLLAAAKSAAREASELGVTGDIGLSEARSAAMLHGYASELMSQGRAHDALPPALHAIVRAKKAVEVSAAHRDTLARALVNATYVTWVLEQDTESMGFAEHAVDIFRQLVHDEGSRHERGLATALINLSVGFTGAKQQSKALESAEEAVALFSGQQDGSDPEAPKLLADALSTWADALFKAGMFQEAEATVAESLAIRRGLGIDGLAPDDVNSAITLADALVTQADCLLALDRDLDMAGEAIATALRIIDAHPGLVRSRDKGNAHRVARDIDARRGNG
ncbi:hypothetical protein OG361_31135 [Streptomyces sp. NBC_00090]|uniref:hypothetical protein n=1 Tax=Streptomyces sp. NBC_00090 TaxID=2903619 RepID=UPI00324CF0D0